MQYFDTSSLVKAYITEEHSDIVRWVLADLDSGETATSLIAYPEMRATFAAALRDRRMSNGEYAGAVSRFETAWDAMRKLPVDDALVRNAGDLAAEHGLRGSDSIHLASALSLQQRIRESIEFSAYDDRLLRAAESCGLQLSRASFR